MAKPKEERGISISLKKSSWDLVQRALDFWVTFDDSPEKEAADALNQPIDTKVKQELARRGAPKK